MYMTENQKIASAYRKIYESSSIDQNFVKNNHVDAKNDIQESFFSFRDNSRRAENMTEIFNHNERRLIEEWQKIPSGIKNEYINNLIRYIASYVASGRLNENEIKNLLYNALSYSSTDKPYKVIMELIDNTKMRQEYNNTNNAYGQSKYGRSYDAMNGNNDEGGNRQNRNPFHIIHL